MWFKNNALVVLGGIFGSVGVVMGLLAAVMLYGALNLHWNGVRTTGEVIEIVTSTNDDGTELYKPRIRYQADGEREYLPSLSTNIGVPNVGDRVEVIYDINDPSNVSMDNGMDLWSLPALFGMFALTFGGVGGGMLLTVVRKKRRYAWLKTNGMMVTADFVGTIPGRVVVNGASGWVVSAQWHSTIDNTIYTFQSDQLWADPTPFIKDKKVSVLIDPANPKRYMVDLSFMPRVE